MSGSPQSSAAADIAAPVQTQPLAQCTSRWLLAGDVAGVVSGSTAAAAWRGRFWVLQQEGLALPGGATEVRADTMCVCEWRGEGEVLQVGGRNIAPSLPLLLCCYRLPAAQLPAALRS